MAKEYLKRETYTPGATSEGEFLAIEDFEVAHYFAPSGTATKYHCYRSPTASKAGNFGMVMDYTGVAAIGDYVDFWYPYALEPTPGLAVEMVFNLYSMTGNATLEFMLVFPDIGDRKVCTAKVKINTSTLDVSVWNSAGAWESVGTLDQKRTTRWLILYLELDKTANKYKSLIIGGQTFAVSTVAFEKGGSVDLQQTFEVLLTSLSANNHEIWIDRVLIRATS